jgi:hypothetical protein
MAIVLGESRHGAKISKALTAAPRWASVGEIDGAKMTPTVIILAAGCAALGLAVANVASARTADGGTKSVLSERARRKTKSTSPRMRIRVTPAYPYRTFSTDYPVPYKYEYPGPGFVRQCTSWLAPENRASGPVIVPRMRCWWQPG